MTKRITDRDMLARTLFMIEGSNCCDAFESMGTYMKTMCPGPDHKPIPMTSCAQATAAYELREYMRRHGGWCPEHGQHLDKCHGGEISETGYNPNHTAQYTLCHCRPVKRGNG